MAGHRQPGPQCQTQAPIVVDDGTTSRTAMRHPGPLLQHGDQKTPSATSTQATPPTSAVKTKTSAKDQRTAALEIAALPETAERQLLVAVIYAESGTAAFSGEENADEKLAIGWVFVNRAYYAQMKAQDGKTKCYNEAFGDGTVLGAIKTGSAAYNPTDKHNKKVDNAPWHDIMNGNRMKSLEDLAESLKDPGKFEHFRLSVEAANKIDPYVKQPKALPKLSSKVPVAFNQAVNAPPSPLRMEWIGKLSVHSFYGFKEGRECQ